MSDNDAQTCKEGDVIELFKGKNISASQTPCMGQWMAHWMQPCKSSSSKDCQLHSDALANNILHKFKEHDSSELDRLKFKEFKEFKLMNQRYSFVDKGKSNSAAEDDPVSYDIRSGQPCVHREKFKIKENFSMKRNVEPINAVRKFSKKLSTQQLTECSIKWKNSASYCCHSLDVSESNFEHLPMLDINRKIETMLASKEKSAYGAMSVRMVKENHVIGESIPTDFLYSFSAEGQGSKVKVDSSSWLLLDQRRPGKTDGSDVNHLPRQMPKCSIYNMSLTESCQNLKSVEIGERYQKFSSTVKYLLVTDKMGKDQWLGERTMGDSAFTQVDDNNLPKTVTIPGELSCGKKEKSAMRLENFVSDEDRNDRNDSGGTHLMGAHNDFSTKVDTISNHPLHGSSYLLGKSISSPQKATASSNLRNSKTTSASSAPELVAIRNAEIGMANREEHLASIDELPPASHTEASVSSTESLAADHIVSHVKVSDVSSSNHLADPKSGSETIGRWIKRLRSNHSESLSLCTKRSKKGDDSSSERIQNHNPLSSGSENVLLCGDSDESLQFWIRRWCRNDHEESQTASRTSLPLTFQPEKLSVPLEKFEGKMPASIGAMALMGRAMNNYTPCRFRREEGSLVWNTEE